jgi:parallel beta-helix repeat protein
MRFKFARSFSVIGFSALMLLSAIGLVGRSTRSVPIVQASPDRSPQAATRYVGKTGFDSGNCTSSAIPCRTIQYAVDQAAASGDTIRVAQGTYTQTNARPRNDIVATGNVTQVVYISKSLTIRGGYTTTDNFVSYHPLTQTATIDAQNKGRGAYIVNGAFATVRDLRITNGNANNMGGDSSGMDSGGGIYAYGGGVGVIGNSIFNNTAEAGGGVYLNNLICLFCFQNAILTNTATISGGGVVLVNSPGVALVQNDISGNSATHRGGGVLLRNSGSIVQDNTINRNSAGSQGGGGIGLEFSDNASVTGNTFMQNSVSIGNAGAVFLERSSATVAGNTMISNSAGFGGAMYVFFSNNGSVSNNVMRGNTATNNGGGIYLQSTRIELINNIIVDNHIINSTKKGSGIFVQQSAARLTHNTIARNTGGDNSGLSFSTLVALAPLVMTNTIIVNQLVGITTTAGNTATVRGVLFFGNGTNTTGAGPINVTNLHSGDPLFAADGYHLKAGSGAIDNGISAGVATDIDGETRPSGAASDLGADEFVPQPDVAITKIGPSIIISPSSTLGVIPYRIVLTNVGSITLTNIVVTDTLPTGMQADSTIGQTCFPITGAVKCTVASLSVGATKVFTIFASVNTPPACGTLMTNQVVAAPAEGDVNPADNTATSQATFVCPVALSAVNIAGPVNGLVGTTYVFTAAVVPISVTLPITYIWRATNQVPVTHTGGGLSDLITYTWNVSATQRITVTAKNRSGTISNTHSMAIIAIYKIYLPLVLKNF